MKLNKKLRSNLITYGIVIIAFLVAQLANSGVVPGFSMSSSLSGQLIPLCVYIVMAVSLNLTVGISGELSLGHAGFMSVGAFSGILMSSWLVSAFQLDANTLCSVTVNGASQMLTVDNALLTTVDDKLSFLPGALEALGLPLDAVVGEISSMKPVLDTVRLIAAIIAGGAIAGLTGVLVGVPVLRLRGDYLAIVTLAFGEIIRNVLTCLYFSVDGFALHASLTDPTLPGSTPLPGKMVYAGPKGAVGVETIATFGVGFVLVLVTLFVVLNLINSRSGRAIMAIRDSRIAAESVGLNVTKYKMMAFVTSAVLAGMAGALYGLSLSTVTAAKFKFDTSILVLVFVVLGGIGNIRGSVIAAAALTLLPEMLRSFNNYRMLVYAIVLIVVMLARNSSIPKNLWAWLMRFKTLENAARKVGGWKDKLLAVLHVKKAGAGKAGDDQ